MVESLVAQGASKDRAVFSAAYTNNQEHVGWLIMKGASIECAATGKRAGSGWVVDPKAGQASSQLSRSPHVLNATGKRTRQGDRSGDKLPKKPRRGPSA